MGHGKGKRKEKDEKKKVVGCFNLPVGKSSIPFAGSLKNTVKKNLKWEARTPVTATVGPSSEQLKGCHPTELIDGDGNFNKINKKNKKQEVKSRPAARVPAIDLQNSAERVQIKQDRNFTTKDEEHHKYLDSTAAKLSTAGEQTSRHSSLKALQTSDENFNTRNEEHLKLDSAAASFSTADEQTSHNSSLKSLQTSDGNFNTKDEEHLKLDSAAANLSTVELVKGCHPTELINGDGNFNKINKKNPKQEVKSRPVARVPAVHVQYSAEQVQIKQGRNFNTKDEKHHKYLDATAAKLSIAGDQTSRHPSLKALQTSDENFNTRNEEKLKLESAASNFSTADEQTSHNSSLKSLQTSDRNFNTKDEGHLKLDSAAANLCAVEQDTNNHLVANVSEISVPSSEQVNGYDPDQGSPIDRKGDNQTTEYPIASVSTSGVQSCELLNCNDPAQLIDKDGNFHSEVEKNLNLDTESCPLAAVSIIGVQSTGKSTLLNQLFGTRFKEMDADEGLFQTTQGIWVAKCPSPTGGRPILVIDTEGSDGSERDEDDIIFEKQIALFALAISDTMIINMKCHNVNLNNGASRPLIRTVIEVMVRKFNTPRKVNIVFVLRDKNRVPLQKLEEQLKEGLHQIWDEMTKPQALVNALLEDYLDIKVVALSHYWLQEKEFNMEVAALKARIFTYSTSGQLATEKIAASDFIAYAKRIWDDIKKDKALELPNYRTMVAEVNCNRIAEEKYQNFCKNESWLQIKEALELQSGGFGQGFGNKVNSLIDTLLSEYDKEALYFDESVRYQKRKQLTERLLEIIEPAFLSTLERIVHATLEEFKEAIDNNFKGEGKAVVDFIEHYIPKFRADLKYRITDAAIKQANWNYSTEKYNMLERGIDAYKDQVSHFSKIFDEGKDHQDEERAKILCEFAKVALDQFREGTPLHNERCEKKSSSEASTCQEPQLPSSSQSRPMLTPPSEDQNVELQKE